MMLQSPQPIMPSGVFILALVGAACLAVCAWTLYRLHVRDHGERDCTPLGCLIDLDGTQRRAAARYDEGDDT